MVVVVGLAIEATTVDTLILKSFLNTIYTVVTKLDVDVIVTSVVICPTSETIVIVLISHNVSNCVYNFHLNWSDVRLTSWVIDSSERTFNLSNIDLATVMIFLLTFFEFPQAVVELVLEILALA